MKKADYVFLLLIFFPASLLAQPTFYENLSINVNDALNLASSQTRHVRSLAGAWTAIFPDGQTMTIHAPSATTFQGAMRFEKTIFIEESEEANVFALESEGIGGACNVLINDQFVALHLGNFAPFSVEIPSEHLRFGAKNKITIEVDSRLDFKNTIPPKAQAFEAQFFGGLVRNLALVSRAPIRIDNADVKYRFLPNDSVEINVQARCKTSNLIGYPIPSDSAGNRWVSLTFSVMKDSVAIASGILHQFLPESDRFIAAEKSITLPAVQRWSPTSPARYWISFALRAANGQVLDDLSFQTGFRTVEAKEGGIFLNGEVMALKGVRIVEDNPETACALSKADVERDLALVRSLGANALYFDQIPHPLWQRYADSLGFLVFINLPFRYAPSSLLLKPKILDNAESLLRALIEATKFSPSVVGYGFGGGLDVADASVGAYLERLHALVKGRSQNLAFFAPKDLAPSDLYRYADFLGASALNLPVLELEARLKNARALQKPVVVTGYGVYAEPNNHNGYGDPHSLEHQAKFLMDAFKMFERLNESGRFIAGSFVESLSDYRLRFAPILNAHNPDPYLATTGLTTFGREKKLAFEMVKALYAGERVYNPPIGKAEAEFSPLLILTSVLLVVGFVYMLNGNKRLRENFPRALSRPFNLFVDIRDSRIYVPSDTIALLLFWSLGWAATLSAILYAGRESFLVDFWLTHFLPTQDLKQRVNVLVLNPSLAVPTFAASFLALSSLVAAFARLWLFLIRNDRARYSQLLSVWAWSCAHWVLALPLAAFIERLESESFICAVIVGSVSLLVLTLGRFLMGVATVAELNRSATYLYGFLFVAATLGGFLAIYDRANQTFAYFQYWHVSK